ncbi:MAG: serine protease [Elusimicrobiota bacterium]
MKNTTLKLIVISLIPFPFTLNALNNKVIYGEDNRKDYFEMSSEIKTLADSVVSLWDSANIRFDSSKNKYTLVTQNYGQRLNLCEDEPFRDQPIGAFCSGLLIADDTIITAGHCINTEAKCSSTYFVFGYAIKDRNNPFTATTEIPASDVYKCSKIIKTHIGAEPTEDNPQGIGLGSDFAIIKLDRKVSNRKPLKINTNQKLSIGQSMFVIGHPVGLPVKFADGATVRDPSPNGYFVANLDTYGGNSGSPVFDMKTKLIEGILVRGDNDFVQTPMGCTISNRVEDNGGRGEDSTKISALYPYLSEILTGIKDTGEPKSIQVKTDFDSFDTSKAINFSFDR